MAAPQIVLPGQVLGPLADAPPGAGTYAAHGSTVSSLAGALTTTTSTTTTPRTTTTVSRPAAPALPTVGATVLARVVRLTPRQAHVAIEAVGGAALASAAAGLVRVQDVRATEKDRVRLAEAFRVGDVLRAAVVSVGDERNYYLSTASNALGVVLARSEGGLALWPVSWREMRDADGRVEARKVAKPE